MNSKRFYRNGSVISLLLGDTSFDNTFTFNVLKSNIIKNGRVEYDVDFNELKIRTLSFLFGI
ncbi:hypothetical protein RhiirB3_434062 [Rhizophagus irregularis]|nr:hypothetical protein RhiirB3_434062 [Rhizophagus irregularis]